VRAACILLLAWVALACRRSPRPPAPISDGTAAAARALGIPVPFQPPADGLVTDEQLDQFLRVRRAAKGRTDAENARALGLSAEEVAWTRARIVEALAALDEKNVREASAESYSKSVAALRAARAEAATPEQRRTLEDQIAVLDRERASLRREDTPTAALAANMRRVAARQADLAAVAP
jgi:hypothetical protein